MLKKSILMTLGAGYICTQVSNVKKVDINDELSITLDLQNNSTAIFITNKDEINTILALELDKETSKLKITDIDNESYIDWNVINIINNINKVLNLNINNYIKFDISCVEEILKYTGDISVKLSVVDLILIDSIDTKSDDNMYNLTSNDIVEYITKDSVGKTTPIKNRQQKIVKAIMNRIFDLSTKEFIKVIGSIIPMIETTLETKELIAFGLATFKAKETQFTEI